MVDDRELDSILDNGLARYSEAEPLAGMEERILERVGGVPRRRNRAGFAAALSCAAAAVVAFLVFVPGNINTRKTGVDTSVDAARTSARATTKADSLLVHTVQRRARRAARLPKQPDFPARTPMSPEERGLLKVETQSGNISTELAKSAEPITIEPIEVAPVIIDESDDFHSGAGNESNNL